MCRSVSPSLQRNHGEGPGGGGGERDVICVAALLIMFCIPGDIPGMQGKIFDIWLAYLFLLLSTTEKQSRAENISRECINNH